MKQYDLTFFIPGSLSDGEAPGVLEEVKNLLSEVGAEGIKFSNAGRQKLAFPVKGNSFGLLINFSFSLLPEKIKTLKDKLALEPMVARFMLTHHQEKTILRPRFEKAAAVPKPAPAKVDLAEIDKKIEEILQQDSLVV